LPSTASTAKEKRLALGSYPGVTLKAAREGRDLARKAREGGSDPVQVRQAEKLTRGGDKCDHL
jgi:hypothetical protein